MATYPVKCLGIPLLHPHHPRGEDLQHLHRHREDCLLNNNKVIRLISVPVRGLSTIILHLPGYSSNIIALLHTLLPHLRWVRECLNRRLSFLDRLPLCLRLLHRLSLPRHRRLRVQIILPTPADILVVFILHSNNNLRILVINPHHPLNHQHNNSRSYR